MSKIVAIRPEPGLASTKALGQSIGLHIQGKPLSTVIPCGWHLPALSNFDALLVGSANVFRHGGAKLSRLKHLPVVAVGKTTSEAAEQLGFDVTYVGQDGLQNLITGIGLRYRNYLRLSGENHISLSGPEEVKLTTLVVYKLKTNAIEEDMAAQISDGAIVLLHSANAAKHFESECHRLDISRTNISLCALGPRILEPVGTGWKSLNVAPRPTDLDLLSLAKKIARSF